MSTELSGVYTTGIVLSDRFTTLTSSGTVTYTGDAVYGSPALSWQFVNLGQIQGGADGILMQAPGVEVSNYGTVTAVSGYSFAIRLKNGGRVTNGTGGLLEGLSAGIQIDGSSGTVTNSGTIVGIALYGDGVVLSLGGEITNNTNAVIRGADESIYVGGNGGIVNNFGTILNLILDRPAIRMEHSPGTVVNSGTITASGQGIVLHAGGTVVNYGVVSATGSTTAGVELDGAGTVDNFGAITGEDGIAISLSGHDELIIEAGSTLNGAIGNFQPGDTIDLPFLRFAAGETATLTPNNVLEIRDAAGSFSVGLDPANDFSGYSFALSPDSNGNTLVTEALAPPPSVADDLSFSNLAYHGPDTTLFYSTQLTTYATKGDIDPNWGLALQSTSNQDSYFGLAFKNDITKQIVIANRGSGSTTDWGVTDNDIYHHTVPPAFADAISFAQTVESAYPGYICFVTGHSLGGAEAEYLAADLHLTGMTFAAPGVQWALPGSTANITDYAFYGDPVAHSDTPIGTLVNLGPNGPLQLENVAKSIAIDSALAGLGPLGGVLASNADLICLHTLDNYLEHFGILSSEVPVIYPGAISPIAGLLMAIAPKGHDPSADSGLLSPTGGSQLAQFTFSDTSFGTAPNQVVALARQSVPNPTGAAEWDWVLRNSVTAADPAAPFTNAGGV